MADAEQTGRTAQQKKKDRDRLNDIWEAWDASPGAKRPDQYAGLDAVASWLDEVEDNPAELARGVQVLLCDPQTPGIHKRLCWKPIRAVLRDVPVDPGEAQMVQALLLAAWPTKPETKRVPQLLRQAWEVQRGRAVQRPTLERWLQEMSEPAPPKDGDESLKLSAIEVASAPTAAQHQAFQNYLTQLTSLIAQGSHSIPHWQPHLIGALTDLRGQLVALSQSVGALSDAYNESAKAIVSMGARDTAPRAEQDLLWWGQARYSTRLQKPYRRLEHREDAVFWAALEAAERVSKAHVEVEPAAAYLVEVLHALGLDVEEKKPLRTWMEILSTTLTREPKAPSVEGALVALAEEDALGLPVTWARLRAREKDGLAQAAEKVGLALDETIDRGAWATWIFREVLLERLLAEGSAP